MTKKESAFVWADLAPTPCHINGLLGFVDLGSWRGGNSVVMQHSGQGAPGTPLLEKKIIYNN